MRTTMPALSHEEQQIAAERINALIAEGMSSAAAIAQVAEEIRQTHKGEMIHLLFEDDENTDNNEDETEDDQ